MESLQLFFEKDPKNGNQTSDITLVYTVRTSEADGKRCFCRLDWPSRFNDRAYAQTAFLEIHNLMTV